MLNSQNLDANEIMQYIIELDILVLHLEENDYATKETIVELREYIRFLKRITYISDLLNERLAECQSLDKETINNLLVSTNILVKESFSYTNRLNEIDSFIYSLFMSRVTNSQYNRKKIRELTKPLRSRIPNIIYWYFSNFYFQLVKTNNKIKYDEIKK